MFQPLSLQPLSAVSREHHLHAVEQFARNDCVMQPGIALAAMDYLSSVEPVLQQCSQHPLAERDATNDPAITIRALLGSITLDGQLIDQGANRPEFNIAREQVPYDMCLSNVDRQPAFADFVAKRGRSAHPHATGLGCGNLVADPLTGHLALELGERQQDVERQPSHAASCVEGLGNADERCAPAIENVDDTGKVGEAAGQAIDFVHHDDVDPPGLDLG